MRANCIDSTKRDIDIAVGCDDGRDIDTAGRGREVGGQSVHACRLGEKLSDHGTCGDQQQYGGKNARQRASAMAQCFRA